MQEQDHLKANKYAWLAYVYFFFNGIGLPAGLLFMNLLTPFFYVWLLVKRRKEILLPFLLLLLPFDLVHLWNGVDYPSFVKSNLLFISTYIFVCAFAEFVRMYPHPGKLFRRILIVNFIFTLIAIMLFFTPWREWMWYINKFTATVDQFPRLAMFTYEASYYSLMFAPVACYYLFKVFLRQNEMNPYLILLLVLLPLLLSFSLGVLGAMLIAAIGVYIVHWKKIFYKKNFMYVLLGFLLTVAAVFIFLLVFFPANPLFVRMHNIMMGYDTSANGRTIDSFGMSYRIAKERSIWFGAGLGQVKVLAPDIVRQYYSYWGKLEVVRIPNTIAETLALFGIFGLLIRFLLIFYFFFKTRVLGNYYRTALFFFVFIYQFTGSYITNMVEYVIWVLAFSQAFPMFDCNEKRRVP